MLGRHTLKVLRNPLTQLKSNNIMFMKQLIPLNMRSSSSTFNLLRHQHTTPNSESSNTAKASNSNSTQTKESEQLNKNEPEKLSIKQLLQKYGLPAFIVYNGISLIDLSLTFSLLHFTGEEYVLILQNKLVELWNYLGFSKDASTEISKPDQPHGVSFWSTFAVAYSIHKLLVPVRVPLTAMITPSFAKWGNRYGFFLKKK